MIEALFGAVLFALHMGWIAAMVILFLGMVYSSWLESRSKS